MKEGTPLPKKIAEAPTLGLGLQVFWDAFMELSSCRSIGMAVGPIPWTAIREYGRALNLDEEQQNMLVVLIRAMDNCYREHIDRQSKAKK